jgi:hypothetical protein
VNSSTAICAQITLVGPIVAGEIGQHADPDGVAGLRMNAAERQGGGAGDGGTEYGTAACSHGTSFLGNGGLLVRAHRNSTRVCRPG